MDCMQLGAVVTKEELEASEENELWLAPADQQIESSILMPQLVQPISEGGMEVLLNSLVVAHRQSTGVNTMLGPKGMHPFMMLAADAAIDLWGIAECIIKSDQEPAIMALIERLAEERKIKGYNCQVIAAPKRSHASMGFI